MKILALDSAETTSTAALAEDGRLIGSTTLSVGLSHSETLLPAIEWLMKGASYSYDDIDLFVCTAGPGSFTGVRIGVATVKGLAFGRGKPCIGVSSLHALAYNLTGFEGLICPVMDARRSQVYQALFSCHGGKLTRLTEDRVISLDDLRAELTGEREPLYLLGGGYAIASEALKDLPNLRETPELLIHQNAFSAALCGYERFMLGDIGKENTDISLMPIYLRPSQAERNRCGG